VRGTFAKFGLIVALSAGQTAVTATPASSGAGRCKVVAGGKYLGAGAGSTLCHEIERAIAVEAPGARYSAEVTALSPSRLAATLTVNGHKLPEHKFAVMDAELTPESLRRFAHSLALDVGKATKR